MKRFAAALLPVVGVLWFGCSSCSGKEASNGVQPDGSASDLDAGGDGAGRDSPSEGSLRDRSDGSPGDASDAAMSAVPIWQDMDGTVAGCKVQRLVNASEVRVFTWAPCDSIPGCERAVYDPNVLSSRGGVQMDTAVRETPTSAVAALVVRDTNMSMGVVLTDGEGRAFDGYRRHPESKDCESAIPAISTSGSRVLVVVCWLYANSTTACGGILNSPGGTPVLFDLPKKLNGGPDYVTMGDQRSVWHWVLPTRLTSVNNIDGSGFSVFDLSATSSVLDMNSTSTSGPRFFAAGVSGLDSGAVMGSILVTDGISPPKPYLEPPDDSFYDLPAFAHSHIAWMRGFGMTSLNVYDRVELWASPYNADPTQLKPEKIGDFFGKSLPTGGDRDAAYGVFSTTESDGMGWVRLVIWDLAAKSRREFPVPHAASVPAMPGVTKTHVWLLIDEVGENFAYRLLRFSIR